MRKIILLLILICSFCFAQEWMDIENAWSDFGHTTETDSIFISSDVLILWGNDPASIYIPVNKSQGAMRIWGIMTNLVGGIADTVFFDIAAHSGDGDATQTGYTESYTRVDTVASTAGSTGQFSIWPMANSTLQQNISSFIDLKMTGQNNSKRQIWLKIEWMETN